ncbi:MAG TPA: hypothetical protein VHZ95_08160, partial [Polyangiales bacterium]|nr:hypothetical protein [Polyangiales bacterium]
MRAIGVVVRVLFWIALAAIALAASVVYHLQLPLARHIAKNLTNAFVTGEIRGELAIGRLDVLTLDHVTARHVALFDGEGRRIITADRVELKPDFAMLRRGVLRFRVGQLYGGFVRLVDNGEDEPSLFTTFDARHPSKHSGGGEPLHALVDRVELHDVTLYGQFVQLENVRAEHVEAVGRLEIGRTVEIAIANAHGEMTMPFDFVGQVEQLSGTISTDKTRGVKLDARARRNDEEALAHIEYRSDAPSEPQMLDLSVLTSNISTDTLRKMGFSFAGPLAPNLRGRFHLAGPPSQLAIEAQVQSDAGDADVNGMIDSQGVAVQIWSQRIAVDKLIDGGPTMTVRGSLQIALPEASAQPHVHVELAAVRYRGLVIPPFELDGELVDGGVQIDRARATQGGQISVRGRVNFNGSSDVKVDAHFAAVQRDPNLSHLIDNLEGTLTAAVRVRTPRTDQHALLDISGKIALRDAHYGSISASSLELSGTVRGDPSLPTVDLQVHGENFAVLSYDFGDARFALRGGPHDYVA